MQRITYKMVKEWIADWNNYHPDIQFELSVYLGFYHLNYKGSGENVIVQETPGKLWESFGYWKSGYFEGLDRGN